MNEGNMTFGGIDRKTRDKLKNLKDETRSHNLLVGGIVEQKKVISILKGGEGMPRGGDLLHLAIAVSTPRAGSTSTLFLYASRPRERRRSMALEVAAAATKRKLVFVTAIRRGLGRALAVELAKRGHNVAGFSTTEEHINSLSSLLPSIDPNLSHSLFF
ncbi:hypothetical protein EJ110_NYTH37035 [Nymphaea thermarum]|nr:hypothetical protein EJ110_NYTH37035 [Nymphaea thermarum]